MSKIKQRFIKILYSFADGLYRLADRLEFTSEPEELSDMWPEPSKPQKNDTEKIIKGYEKH